MSLRIETILNQSILLVRLYGELDHHTADDMRERLDQVIRECDVTHLILNLSQLTFMDSSGLGVILGRYKQISSKHGQMVVCSLNPTIYRIFELAGLFKIISVKETEDEALSALGVA